MDDLVIGTWTELKVTTEDGGVKIQLHGVHKEWKLLKPFEVHQLRRWLNQLNMEQFIRMDDEEVNDYKFSPEEGKPVVREKLPASERMPFNIVDCY
jgi:hypothetical protein